MSGSFTDKDRKEIDDIIRSSSSSEAVFSDRFLGDNAGRYIFDSLKQASIDGFSPKTVDCKGCYMGGESALALADLLKHPSCGVVSLSLEWNSIGSFESGLQEVAQGLALNTSLVTLDLRNNNVGHSGGSALARGLRDNSTLEELDLRWNEIGNSGGLAFKELLSEGLNHALKSVKVAGNKMTDAILTDVEGLVSGFSSQRICLFFSNRFFFFFFFRRSSAGKLQVRSFQSLPLMSSSSYEERTTSF